LPLSPRAFASGRCVEMPVPVGCGQKCTEAVDSSMHTRDETFSLHAPARLDMGRFLTALSPIFQHDSAGLQLRSGRFPVAPVRSSQDRLSLVGFDCPAPPLSSLSPRGRPMDICGSIHCHGCLVPACINVDWAILDAFDRRCCRRAGKTSRFGGRLTAEPDASLSLSR
jgi:hypothetical protein